MATFNKKTKKFEDCEERMVNVVTMDDAMQLFSGNLQREISINQRCVVSAVAFSALNTLIAWGSTKAEEILEKNLPKCVTNSM